MAETSSFSDGAYAVFAFAAYHQLQSGQPVTKIVLDDGQGHKADEAGVSQLAEAGLATAEGKDLVFTQAGLDILARVVTSLKSAAADASPST